MFIGGNTIDKYRALDGIISPLASCFKITHITCTHYILLEAETHVENITDDEKFQLQFPIFHHTATNVCRMMI